ncbi:MAG: TetR/AcrR family transcriptional regulator [Planctomycetes bacterium]|nr:TetR/AcrR family transcriptional regulator [Planctomycetota bacterium]
MDRKAEIRRKAAAVFAEQGFDRASIRDVAKATGLSLAGLYYYYKGKEEILFDIQREAFTTLLDAHAKALAGVRDPEQKLRRVVDAHLAFFAEHIAEMKVMSRESEQLQDDYAEQVDELKRRYGPAHGRRGVPPLRDDELGLHVVRREARRQPRGDRARGAGDLPQGHRHGALFGNRLNRTGCDSSGGRGEERPLPPKPPHLTRRRSPLR